MDIERPGTPFPQARQPKSPRLQEGPTAVWIIRLSSNEEKLSFSEGEEDLDHPGFEVFTAGETLDRMQLQHTRPVQYHMAYARPEDHWKFELVRGYPCEPSSTWTSVGVISKAPQDDAFQISGSGFRCCYLTQKLINSLDAKVHQITINDEPFELTYRSKGRVLECWNQPDGLLAARWNRLSPPGVLDGRLDVGHAFSGLSEVLLLVFLALEELARERDGTQH